ncbi:hypothetical protein [Caulobacter sp. RHG1]|uniref:hypothetical protein n=1 Tax=Caulobacter sp. (strain RHG1) TaxID=2545762 RepID=UPI0015560B66|nr:hypothetical protein [Caulobacter sp. RHG1]NQE61722.1 hypothetical protein [Caulobacter sp. RHG1]
MTFKSIVASGIALALFASAAPNVALARQAPAVTPASLQQTIASAAAGAAAQPGFSRLTPARKLAAIQAAVSAALAASGASAEQISAALISAVGAGVISAGVAISIASAVAPEMAQQVANAPAVTAQLQATGQSAQMATASIGGTSVSVLQSLQGASGAGGGGAANTAATPAPYDPCAGVIATYCGT